MQFDRGSSIYIQIGEYVLSRVLSGSWEPGDRIPSVREMAVELEVNPNTVLRSYALLQDEGVVHNKRGIGYCVDDEGVEAARETMRDELRRRDLPEIFERLRLVGVTADELAREYGEYLESREESDT